MNKDKPGTPNIGWSMPKEFPYFPLVLSLIAGSLSLHADQSPSMMERDNQNLIAASWNQKGKSEAKKVETCQDITAFSPCPNHWRFSGDYLYFLPTVDDTYFVIDSPTLTGVPGSTDYPSGKRKNNDFGFHSGFRAGAEFAMCHGERELEAYYTYLSTKTRRTVSGDYLWATSCPTALSEVADPTNFTSVFQDYSGTAFSKLSLFYERLDVDFSQQIFNAHGVHGYVKAGLECARLRLHEYREYVSYNQQITNFFTLPGPDIAIYKQKSQSSGIGPQVGLAIDYNFYETQSCQSTRHAFSMTGLFSGSILVSQQKSKTYDLTSVYNGELTDFTDQIWQALKDEKTWRMLPVLHARVGFNYTVRGCSAGLSLEVGYEFNSYIRGLQRPIFTGSNGFPSSIGESFNQYDNFDIQGLYANLGISF